MKRYIIVLCCLVFSLSIMAQKFEQGSLALLNNVEKANFQIEFLSIHGMTENDFSKYEADWETDKPTVVAIFTDYANRKLKGKLLLGNFPKEKYTVKAIVNEINQKGNYDCDIVVLGSNKQVIAKITGVRAEGGVWGTKLNLIKDGAENTGKKFGEILKSELAKSKK